MSRTVEKGANDCEQHFIFASGRDVSKSTGHVVSFFCELMREAQLQSVILSTFQMSQRHLITQEEMKSYCLGKDRMYPKSINDDLEKMFEELQIGETNYLIPRSLYDELYPDPTKTYFLSKLTKDEMALIEMKDWNYFRHFAISNPDVDKEDMEMSSFTSKFIFTICDRETYRIDSGGISYTSRTYSQPTDHIKSTVKRRTSSDSKLRRDLIVLLLAKKNLMKDEPTSDDSFEHIPKLEPINP